MHNILEDNDPDTIECKDEYNEALIHNKEVQIFHKTIDLKDNLTKKIMETIIQK